MPIVRRLFPGLLILVIGLTHWLALRPGHEWGDDFALYVLHARNLVEGRPYADTGYLYNPSYPSIGPPTYPPVTPVVLAPVYAVRGLDLEAMKRVMVVCFVGFLVVLYLLVRADLDRVRSALVIALVGFNGFFLQETNTIGSDELFLAFLYLAMLLMQRAGAAAEDSPAQWTWHLSAAVVAYLAYGTRSLGALLIAALAFCELIAHRRIRRPALAAIALFACLALGQTLFVHSDQRYLDQFRAGPGVLVQHASWYGERLAAFWSNGRWRVPAILLAAESLLLASAGFAWRARRGVDVCQVFAVVYVVAILVWPSYEAERYLYPVIPLWIFYAFCGFKHPWLAERPRLGRAAFGLLLTGAALTYAGRYAASDWGPLRHGVHTREAQQLFGAITANTPPDAVVVFAKPRAMALMTRRASAAPHVPQHAAELWAYLERIRAGYLVVTNRDGVFGRAENVRLSQSLRAFVAQHARRFVEVGRNADFTIYRIDIHSREG